MRARQIGMALTVFVGAAVATVAAVPTGGASTTDEVVRLHFGTTSHWFTFGDTTQAITVGKNTCAINSAETLIDLSADLPSSQAAPGFADDGIGVKATRSSANGTPCAQVDATERLVLQPGTALAGRSFRELRLDVEMTGNAVVLLTMTNTRTTPIQTQTHELRTGTSVGGEVIADTTAPYLVTTTSLDSTAACAAASNSGPNSAGNDNCLWTVQPSITFDKIEIRTTVGTVSLEGSNDFGNDPAHDSLFVLANGSPLAVDDTVSTNKNSPVTFNVLTNDTDPETQPLQVFSFTAPTNGTLVENAAEGSFTYSPNLGYVGPDSFTYVASDGTTNSNAATVNITVVRAMCSGETVSDSEGEVFGSFTRLTDDQSCKQYTLVPDSFADSLLFLPIGGQDVIYRGFVRFASEPAPSGTANLVLGLEYDPAGGTAFRTVQWCDGQTFDSAGLVVTAVLPPNETWCIVSESTVGSGQNVQTTWQVYGEDDPRFQ